MTTTKSYTLLYHLMTEFATQAGLSPAVELPRRYLWSDAFAICNFLELYRQSGDDSFKSLAINLIDQVHYQLGRHRKDDTHRGHGGLITLYHCLFAV